MTDAELDRIEEWNVSHALSRHDMICLIAALRAAHKRLGEAEAERLKLVAEKMPERMPVQDQAFVYQQIAALVCQDMDLLMQLTEITKDLKRHIELMCEKKERYIKDKEFRDRSYEASSMIAFSGAAWLIRNDPVDPDGRVHP